LRRNRRQSFFRQTIHFDEVKNEVQQMLLRDKRKQILSQYIEKLQSEANIVYVEPKE
jgi:hypothetical protein